MNNSEGFELKPEDFEQVKIGKKLYDKAYIYYDELKVELDDGRILPITNMLNDKGNRTIIPEDVRIIQAGEGDCWVNLRIL